MSHASLNYSRKKVIIPFYLALQRYRELEACRRSGQTFKLQALNFEAKSIFPATFPLWITLFPIHPG